MTVFYITGENVFNPHNFKPSKTKQTKEEWIDYNIDRALPYMGGQAPIIVIPVENDFEDDEKKC